MARTEWLIDTSASSRTAVTPDRTIWLDRLAAGRVRWASVTRMQLGFAARDARELVALGARPPNAALIVHHLDAAGGRARRRDTGVAGAAWPAPRASPARLLVAAAAELGGDTVVHVDRDFELIAAVTAQPKERLRPSDGLPDATEEST